MRITIQREVSPRGFDVAFTSISYSGASGYLNSYVLNELGYSKDALPEEENLRKGTHIIGAHDKTPVVLVVTVGNSRSPRALLVENLSMAFSNAEELIAGSRVWIPLMGTGVGALDYRTSFESILEVIQFDLKILAEEIVISVPKDVSSDDLSFMRGRVGPMEPEPEKLRKRLDGRKIWLAGHTWDGEDQLPRFAKDNIWQNGKESSFENAVNGTKTGDLVLIKSTYRPKGRNVLRVKGFGLVFHNEQNGHDLGVHWHLFGRHVDFEKLGKFSSTYQQLTDHHYEEVLQGLIKHEPKFFDIIEKLSEEIKSGLVQKIDEIKESFESEVEEKQEVVEKIPPEERYWWLRNNGERWIRSDLKQGDLKVINSDGPNGRKTIYENFLNARVGDSVVGFEPELNGAVNVMKITKEINDPNGGELIFETVTRFDAPILWEEIKNATELEETLGQLFEADLQKISREDFETILKLGVIENWDSIISNSDYVQESKIANYSADIDDGRDHLGIDKDVDAFAKVIAANKFSPPLAIGLFGKWGMGKSFFMRKLKDRIKHYTKISEENADYCSGVAHIHFNAWSYMDANLWASFVTRIFEGLNEYISDSTATEDEKAEIEKILSNELQVIRKERKAIEDRKETFKKEIEGLEKDKGEIEEKLEKEIESIENQTLESILETSLKDFKLKDEVNKAIESNQELKDLRSDLQDVLPDRYRENPELAIQQLSRVGTFVREILRDRSSRNRLFVAAIIAIIIFVTPIILQNVAGLVVDTFVVFAQFAVSAIAIASPLIRGYRRVYDKLRPVIAELWNVQKAYDKKVEEAQFAYQQKKEAMEISIARKETEIATINNRIVDLDKELKELEFRLDHGLSTQTLYSFIEKRAASKEYKQHLGIISTIRHDFEVMSSLFLDAQSELNTRDELTAYSQKKLQRIVLYVDDLDRCPEERVVEVLEAVNLLMAFPLFVVVVGVDPRWVKNALLKKYKLQFGVSEKDIGAKQIEAANYLEKIFQVPFHLQEAEDKDVKKMLHQLNASNIRVQEVEPIDAEDSELPEEPNSEPEPAIDPAEEHEEIITTPQEEPEAEAELKEELELYPEEVELMKDLSRVIGNNPRAIKRFVNVYQIVRAHEGLPSIGEQSRDHIFAQIMFLLALPLGPFRELTGHFNTYIEESKTNSVLGHFLDTSLSMDKEGDLNKLKNQLHVVLSDSRASSLLQQTLCRELYERNRFIKRFTFSELY